MRVGKTADVTILFRREKQTIPLTRSKKKTPREGVQRVKKVFLPRCVRFPNFWKKFGKRFDWTRKETLTVSFHTFLPSDSEAFRVF